MKITALEVASFRGIKSLQLDFGDVTVLAGRNGSGKSAVLSALATLLSHAARELSPSRDKVRLFDRDDISNGADFLSAALTLQVQGQEVRVGVNKSRELPLVDRDETPLDARYSRDKKSENLVVIPDEVRVEPMQSRDLTSWKGFTRQQKTIGRNLAVYYSTRRGFWSDVKTLSSSANDTGGAFRGALSGEGIDLGDFAFWLYAAERRGFAAEETDLMREAIEGFLPGFKNLRVEVEERWRDERQTLVPHLLIEKEGVTLDLNQLSDGERGVLSIVLDLSRRLSRAGMSRSEGEAIVLIDEIDLHLHPRLQREVLDRLHLTFPACQFIVSTHSPQVIGQTPPEQLFYLERRANEVQAIRLEASFGRDTNWVLEQIMETPTRDAQISQELDDIAEAVEQGHFKMAREQIRQMRVRIGSDVELDAAEVRIDRMEILGELDDEEAKDEA